MSDQLAELTIRKTIAVYAAQDHAFRVFTEEIGSWWPLDTKSIGSGDPETAVIEPRAGGRWFERAVDGSECDWGTVVAYEPPHRLVLNWQIGADWRYDPTVNTELEVQFIPEGEARTRLELEHRGLREAYGEKAPQMHAIFDSPDGWEGILAGYIRLAGG